MNTRSPFVWSMCFVLAACSAADADLAKWPRMAVIGEYQWSQAMDDAFGAGTWDHYGWSEAVPSGVFEPGAYGFVLVDGTFCNAPVESFIDTNRHLLQSWTAAGGSLFLNVARREPGPILPLDVGFGATLQFRPSYGGYAANPAHPIFDESTGYLWSGNSFSHEYFTGDGLEAIIRNRNNDLVLGEMSWEQGHVLLGGLSRGWYEYDQCRAVCKNIVTYACTVPEPVGVVSALIGLTMVGAYIRKRR